MPFLSFFTSLSSAKIYGILALAFLAFFAYHKVTVSHLETQLAEEKITSATLYTAKQSEQFKQQSCLNTQAVTEANLSVLEKKYKVDMKSCNDLLLIKQAEAGRLQFDKTKLEDWKRTHQGTSSGTVLDSPLPDELIDILNGGK